MEFKLSSTYDQRAFTAMARALRKTIRQKRSRRSHVLGWIVIVLGTLLSFSSIRAASAVQFKDVVTWAALLVVLIALIAEDSLNGYLARKRVLPGMEAASTLFREDSYETTTNIGKTEWKYDKINLLAETPDYFVFIFSASHAQVYEKSHIEGGTADEFRQFMEEKTGMSFQPVK